MQQRPSWSGGKGEAAGTVVGRGRGHSRNRHCHRHYWQG
jgi:hypothetical protein